MVRIFISPRLKKELHIYGHELCVPMPLNTELAQHVSEGVTLVQGGCFYTYRAPNSADEIDTEYIESEQTRKNTIDQKISPLHYRLIGAYEVSQALSLLIATYNAIREHGFDGTYRFYLSYYQGDPVSELDIGEPPQYTVWFYKIVQNALWPLNDMDCDDDACFLEFEATPNRDGEINAFVFEQNRWQLLHNQVANNANRKCVIPQPRMTAFEDAPWLASWTFQHEEDGASYAFIPEHFGEYLFRPHPDSGITHFNKILVHAREMAKKEQAMILLEIDGKTIDQITRCFHLSPHQCAELRENISDYVFSTEIKNREPGESFPAFAERISSNINPLFDDSRKNLRDIVLQRTQNLCSLSKTVYETLCRLDYEEELVAEIAAMFLQTGLIEFTDLLDTDCMSIPVVLLDRQADTVSPEKLYTATLEAKMRMAIYQEIKLKCYDQKFTPDGDAISPLARALKMLITPTSIGVDYTNAALLSDSLKLTPSKRGVR